MKLHVLSLLLWLAVPLWGQEQIQSFMYVYDPDLYVNVRKASDSNSTIIMKAYQFQVFAICDTIPVNGWYAVTGGYIHESRLQPLPKRISRSLQEYWKDLLNNSRSEGAVYIVSKDCPEIICYMNFYQEPVWYPSQDSYLPQYNNKVRLRPEYLAIKNMLTGQILSEYHEMDMPSIEIYSGKILFSRKGIYLDSFQRNRNNRICRNITPLFSVDFFPISQADMQSVLTISHKTVQEVRMYEIQKNSYIREIVDKHIGTNNFTFLAKLEYLYFQDNPEALEYYPYILHRFPIDGGGNAEILDFWERFYAYSNRGETILD